MSNQSQNLIQITPKALRKHAFNCIQSQTPFFVWGNPGIGKSRILQALVEAMGYHFEDIRLSQIESVDLRGLPAKQEKVTYVPVMAANGEQALIEARDEYGQVKTRTVTVDGKEVVQVVMVPHFERRVETTVVWAMPDFLRRAKEAWDLHGKPTAFFFDELNSGSPATMAAAYQFINDRRIGCFELGKNDVVFAAGNLESDGGVTNTMPLPLANRFRHYWMTVNTEQWLGFASEAGMHPYVMAYLSVDGNSGKLQDFSVEKLLSSNEKAFATPRSWEMLSKGMYSIQGGATVQSTNKFDSAELEGMRQMEMEEDIDPIGDGDIAVVAASCVGSAIAVDFAAFVKEGMGLPKAREILAGKKFDDLNIKNKGSAQYFIANDCSHALKDMKDKLNAIKEQHGEKSKEYDEFLKTYTTGMENYILFAQQKFVRELFVYGVITVMLKRFKVIPRPQNMKAEVFALIATEFKKAKLSN